MKPTQMMAWLLCLVLAFVGGLVGARAGHKAQMLSKRVDAAEQRAARQGAEVDRLNAAVAELEARLAAMTAEAK